MFLTNPVTIWYTCTVCVSKPPRLGMLDVRTILALFFQRQSREERQRKDLEDALKQCVFCTMLLFVCCSNHFLSYMLGFLK